MQRLRPLNDFIFKKLFGETENIDNLKSFLNAVLNKDKKTGTPQILPQRLQSRR